MLATLLFLTLIYTRLLNATHHFFSLLLVMCALIVSIQVPRKRWRTATAGALLGAASFFTQTHGVAVALACTVFLLWQASQSKSPARMLLIDVALLWGGFAGVLLALSARFIASVGWRQLWYFQLFYPAHYMVHGWHVPELGLPERLTWRRLPIAGQSVFVYLLLPIVYPISLALCWRRRHESTRTAWPAIMLVSLAGIFLLAEVAVSPNWLRIYALAMPGLILTVWLLSRAGNLGRYALGVLWVAVVCLGIAETWARHRHGSTVTDLPAGAVAVGPLAYEKLTWLRQRTRPGEFFFQPAWPGVYLPLQLRNPVFLDALRTNDETRPRYVEAMILQIETRQVRYILWSRRLDVPDPIHPEQDHLSPFADYVCTHYRRIWTFSDGDEVWERK